MARRFQARPSGDSPVQQGEYRGTDLNKIVERAKANMAPLPSGARQPMWGYFSEPDFMAAQNLMVEVNVNFSQLPSKVRDMFQNQPQLLMRFVQDPNNEAQAIELGLIPAKPKPAPTQGQEIAEALAPLLRPEGQQLDLEEESRRRPPQKPRKAPEGD